MIRRLIFTAPLFLAACGPVTESGPRPQVAPPAPVSGLERVMNKDAKSLRAVFGEPDLDVREGPARKLQFTSSICVLDAYLYAPATGREPVVRYIDARRPDGSDFDRASCIAALSRRPAAH